MDNPEPLRRLIFEALDNQIKMNNPPETKATYKRLRKLGFDDYTTKQYLGQCLAVEIYGIITRGEEHNEERYINNLKKLPEEPFED